MSDYEAHHATPLECARMEEGVAEVSGPDVHPKIDMWLRAAWEASGLAPQDDLNDDEVPWCGAFVYACCVSAGAPHVAEIPVRARSWRKAGGEVLLEDAKPGWDIAVFDMAGIMDISVEEGAGHVGFYLGHDKDSVRVFGGNQHGTVGTRSYSRSKLLGIRRLQPS